MFKFTTQAEVKVSGVSLSRPGCSHISSATSVA